MTSPLPAASGAETHFTIAEIASHDPAPVNIFPRADARVVVNGPGAALVGIVRLDGAVALEAVVESVATHDVQRWFGRESRVEKRVVYEQGGMQRLEV